MLQIELMNKMTKGGLGTSGMLRLSQFKRACLATLATSDINVSALVSGGKSYMFAGRGQRPPLLSSEHVLELELHVVAITKQADATPGFQRARIDAAVVDHEAEGVAAEGDERLQ